MKVLSKIKYLLLTVLVIGLLSACTGQADVDLNNYVAFDYDGYDGSGTVRLSVDYNKLLTEKENQLGEKKSMAALRLLRNVDVTANKTEGLSNGEAITVKWGEIDTESLLNDAGLKVSFSEFAATVEGLKELEKVDLFKDIEIKVDGKDTDGYAWFYTSNLPSEYWFVEFTLEKTEKLSNGEKVKVTVSDYDGGDLDKKLADIGKVAAAKEYYYTITGLEELEQYDPFNGLTVNFEGINGEGTVDFDKDSSVNDYIYMFEYVPDKQEGLSNGDVVTINVVNDYGSYDSVEEFAASRGLKLSVTSKEFTVEGLLEPFSDPKQLDDIDPLIFDMLKMEDIDAIKAYWAKGEERSVEPDSLLNIEYLGTIILYQKPTTWYEEHTAMYNMYRCDVKCSFDEPRFVYWYSLYDGITKDKDGIITIPEATNPSSDYTVSTYMISGEAFTTEDRTHFYLGYETYEKLRDNHIRNEDNVIYDDVDATEGDHFQGVFASLELTDKNGATLIGRNDFTNVGSVPVYHDGTYTITAKLADFGIEQTNIDGLSHFAIRFFSNLNKKETFIDINNIDISDVHAVCDGKEVTFTPENVGAGFSPEDTIFWLFDDEMELTGKKAAVRSKGFAFSDTLEITFTVTGLPAIELPSNPAKNGGESTDAGNTTDNTVDEDPESGKNTDVTDNTDNTDNTDTVDNTDNTDNIDNTDNNNTDNTDNTDNVSENGEAAYKVVLESIGDDRTRIIKIVQDYTHMGLINARDLVDDVANGPKVVLQTDEKELAEEIKSLFEEYGATAIIE